MKYISFLFIFLLIYSCTKKKEKQLDFYDKVLDLVIEISNGEIVEFPELYNKLTNEIAEDKNEKLKIAEKLKAKGFKVTNWGRGNHSLGPRIIIINLKKGNCECTVTKIYYSTSVDTLYMMSEKVSCMTVSE